MIAPDLGCNRPSGPAAPLQLDHAPDSFNAPRLETSRGPVLLIASPVLLRGRYQRLHVAFFFRRDFQLLDERLVLVLVQTLAPAVLTGHMLLDAMVEGAERAPEPVATLDEGLALTGQCNGFILEIVRVDLAGIYALDRLAREHPEAYHLQIMNLLCAFIRNPPVVKNQDPIKMREDVKAVMPAICARNAAQIEIEKKKSYFIVDLAGADLLNVNLFTAAIAGNPKPRFKANLEGALLVGTDLSGAVLNLSNLKRANFYRANLKEAELIGTDLDEANLERCKGLTQDQIDYAIADSGNPPNLAGVVDAKTGVPLVWRVLAAKQD